LTSAELKAAMQEWLRHSGNRMRNVIANKNNKE